MDIFELSAALISLAAVFSFLNYHFIRLPTTIGLMLYSLLLSLHRPLGIAILMLALVRLAVRASSRTPGILLPGFSLPVTMRRRTCSATC